MRLPLSASISVITQLKDQGIVTPQAAQHCTGKITWYKEQNSIFV